jgi:hypothetical protein
MHGGSAHSEVLAHRAQGLPLQHHRFHHLALPLLKLLQRCHGMVPMVGSLQLGEALIPALIQAPRFGFLQTPRRHEFNGALSAQGLQLSNYSSGQHLLLRQRFLALAVQPLGLLV